MRTDSKRKKRQPPFVLFPNNEPICCAPEDRAYFDMRVAECKELEIILCKYEDAKGKAAKDTAKEALLCALKAYFKAYRLRIWGDKFEHLVDESNIEVLIRDY